MTDKPKTSTQKLEDRVLILERQVDHLRCELEEAVRRYHASVYTVAWHAVWPLRWIETFIRGFFPKTDPFPVLPRSGAFADEKSTPVETSPHPIRLPLINEEIADRIQSRIEARY